MKIYPIHKKLYPIYLFYIEWIEGFKHEHKPDIPEDRIRNSTSFRKIFKTNQSNEQLQQYADDYVITLKLDSKYKNISDVKIHFEFIENESWVLTWFSHETFDHGQSDEQAIESFKEFIDRKLLKDNLNPGILMGAEDDWRWRSGSEEYDNIPCRCQHCKKDGKLRIAH